MAYKNSSNLSTDTEYTLGEYHFSIERDSVPGSTNDRVTAICTKGN